MKKYKSQLSQFTIIKRNGSTLNRQIKKSKDAEETFREIWDGSIGVYESMMVLYLNQAHNTVGWMMISQGGLSGTVIDVRLIMKGAIDCMATTFMLCHNHPSGNLQPSGGDIEITKNIKKAGEILMVLLLDHLILTEDSYFSFADEGLVIN